MTAPAIPAAPVAQRTEVVDTVHGVAIADPYRWLEDGASQETRAWTAAQNARTDAVLGAFPGRRVLEARLRDLLGAGTVQQPAVRGDRYFYLKREGEQAQPSLRRRDGLDGEERVVVDPNVLGSGGLTALDWWEPSPEGHLVAYGTSNNGDEWSTLRVVDVDTGDHLPDTIDRTRYSSIAWLPGGDGFYYTRYPAPGSVPAGEEEYNSHAFRHRLGDDPAADPKVFGEGRSPQDMLDLAVSSDGRWLAVVAAQGWARSDVFVRNLANPDTPFVPVATGIDALFDQPRFHGGRLFLRSNRDAPNSAVVAVDLAAPDPADPAAWASVVPERPDRVIEEYVLACGRVVVHELAAAASRLRAFPIEGPPAGPAGEGEELPLPGIGTVGGLAGEADNPTLAVGWSSFAVPTCAFAFDLPAGTRHPLAPLDPPPGFDPSEIEVEQIRYPSKDGTEITMFLVHRPGLVRDGGTPTVLAGYGGFNIAKTPAYRPTIPAWVERGGLLAVPNLRGGGEYGEAWHRGGMLGNKQNVFDDFIAAAEWLVAAGYTRPEKLGIWGRSNGGLLVGAALTQRPELFQAVHCGVPLLDMVRYHRFRIARLWVPEYGSAEDPDAFRWLFAYSPYHRVREGTTYPATFITTGEDDSRVDPSHARKMAALLQHAAANGHDDARPILLRAEANAGHGVGKPLAKRVAEAADEGAFFGAQLGVAWD